MTCSAEVLLATACSNAVTHHLFAVLCLLWVDKQSANCTQAPKLPLTHHLTTISHTSPLLPLADRWLEGVCSFGCLQKAAGFNVNKAVCWASPGCLLSA